ncbi:acetolactate synthase-1/2/3 large subunit [Spinactinospora alkalitolerans]|uniref:Acetolactate synthase-1/2/3 large subunit n=1 Tax=Spinactinospora alkalitolerans TaxID=687207 RepID=A0A852TNA7_9ACTN|nr:thiamine pyrophosphate-binding protein [Spinactinospora alkalitolerans]NYE45449.1 acetolactate synthase-1/2/3 large subunit [Spinactinospora alkalitolerans]
MTTSRTGARALIDALIAHGVDTIFCVPGESYLAALDACYESQPRIRVITCRHESGAANMAETYGKLTGRPGICFVTRGPGATHASVGVHTAFQDSTPMILFVGQVPRAARGREAFQEVDYRQMYSGLAKWAAEVDTADQLPELVDRAFYTAGSGRAGPVVLALPEDVLTESTEAADAEPRELVEPRPSPGDLERVRELLRRSRSPLVIVGGGGWTSQAARDLQAFAEANALPVAASFRRQDYIDNTSPSYAGHLGIGIDPSLAQRVRGSDLILAVGTRLGDVPTAGYTLLSPPEPTQTLVHAHPDPDELGRVYHPDVAIVASGPAMAAGLARLDPVDSSPWADQAGAAHEEFLAWQRRGNTASQGVDMSSVLGHLATTLPDDAIITNGAGNYTVWAQRCYTFHTYRTQLAPASGAMGYGVPAAIAAKLVDATRSVVCLAGDGCFLMNGQELATAVQYDLDVVFLVVNNGMYGTIRMHQERHYPGRTMATTLENPDFAAYARAFGAYGEVVEKTAEFPEAFERARAFGGPALLELRTDPELITPDATIADLRPEQDSNLRHPL